MPILKGQDALAAARGAIVLDMGDLRRQAEQILAQARVTGERIVAEARARAAAESEQVIAKAREDGHADGLARGLEEGRKQGRDEALAQMKARLEKLEEAWLAAGGELEARREETMRQAKRGVLELAVAMGRKVVHRVIEVDPGVIEDQLELALGLVLRPLDVTIRVHPEDAPLVDEVMPRLREQYSHLKHVTIVEDQAPGRGGCVIAFGQGRIDASIQTQLERIVQALLPVGTAVAGVHAQANEAGSSSSGDAPDEGPSADQATDGQTPPESR